MSDVIDCVRSGVNGLIESPTGTGKTIAILCGVLAEVKKLREEKKESITVIYCTRTHA
jgi:regulator of telomere elongation helicase 1